MGAALALTDAADAPLLALLPSAATPLGAVGKQPWRGALLLGDWLLHHARGLADAVILELGTGLGVAGMLAARHRPAAAFLTDAPADVLAACAACQEANSQHLGGGAAGAATVHVRRLDWLDPPDWLLPPAAPGAAAEPPQLQQQGGRFDWRPSDVAALQRCGLLLAADCIYDDVLTEGCMRW